MIRERSSEIGTGVPLMKKARAWLTLLRPQNFLTVPGDALAGFFLAGGAAAGLSWRIASVIGAGLFFYGAGLLFNDWADAAVDRIERPERPVPAGLVSRGAVFLAGLIAILFGFVLAFPGGKTAGWIGFWLGLSILSYNLLLKQIPLLGPVNMGICRGLNLLLGAALVGGTGFSELVWWGAGTVTLYIAAVTHLARREVNGRYWAFERWLPALILIGSFLVYLPFSPLVERFPQLVLIAVFAVAAAGAAQIARVLPDRRGLPVNPRAGLALPVPPLIGKLISLLLPLQAGMIIGAGDDLLIFGIGAAVFILWPLKSGMGKFFYSS